MMSLAAWWTDQQAGLIGGLMGSLCGLAGALVGVACWLLIPRGRARRLVLGFMALMALIGIGLLAGGIVAIAGGQPYAVWYPLLLIGALNAGLFGGMMPMIAARYRQAERMRLQGEELRRGGT